jgi:hypothetical protein
VSSKKRRTPEAKAKHRERLKRRYKERMATDPEYRRREYRKESLRHKYHITISFYEALFESQDGKCAICGLVPEPGKRRLAVDHDHETQYIRGLLCRHCNVGLGCFKDDIRLLQNAIDYLRVHGRD